MLVRDKLNSYDVDVLSIVEKWPGLTQPAIARGFLNKHRVSIALRRLTELGMVYSEDFKFYPIDAR